ncbi:hypothetical protein EZS27_021648 [termite gut metagenome]|uniref:Outer membrane protein beta-barrel domain-containing protein n=1 Tax=termite gut metagenome TaxID=433724 RepID=A0A5J4R6D9_9ZZZZ
MKKLLIGVLLLASTSVALAQNKNITVAGIVVEEDTKQAIEQATVQLFALPDTTFMVGAATLARGRFTLPKAEAGKYILKVSFVGFQTKIVPVQLSASRLNHNAGTISLETDAIMLSEALVTAEAPPVTVKGDTIEYNSSAYRVPEGSMLEELVKKLPGAEISDEGKITINGKDIKRIMVDGKEFFSDDPQVSMKNLPVEMVEKIKAYDRKSDMARITGIDDGNEETVLDLTVKKGMKQGWVGNLISGYGNKSRYEANGMMSRFLDDASFSILGSANNTNNRGVSELGDGGGGFGGGGFGGTGSGVTTARSLGMNFARDTKKLQIGGNVQYRYSDNDAQMKSSTETFLGDQSSFGNNTNVSRRKNNSMRADLRLEWRPDTMTTVIFRPSGNYSTTESRSQSSSETLNNEHQFVNSKESNSTSKSETYSFNGQLQLFRKLNNSGRNVSVSGNFGYSDGDTDSESYSDTRFFRNGIQDSTVKYTRYTDRANDSRNWSISASYTEPIFKTHFLQARYEFSHRKRLSESLVSDLDSVAVMPNGYVESLSSRVENFYDTHMAELSLTGIHPKVMYAIGLGANPQSSLSKTTIGPNSAKQLPKQNVINVSPNAMMRFSFSPQQTLMLRYRGQSSAPNIEDLQDVIDQTDPLNIRYGNPNLKPSFNNNMMMFYNKYIPESMRSYSINMFYSSTINSVANKMQYNATNGGRVYERVNVNGNWNANGFFTFNTPLRNKKFTISSSSNVMYSDAVSYTSVGNMDAMLSTTHNLIAGERLGSNYRTNSFDVSLNASINYNKTQSSTQSGSSRETFDYIFGGSTNINLPWQIYFSTDANYRIKKGYSGDFNTSELMWNAQLSKSFLKANAATVRIKIYDILQQQSNLSRSISETMMSDTEYNTLGSYFMVHFVYRLNTLGGRARNSNSQRQFFGPPPPDGGNPGRVIIRGGGGPGPGGGGFGGGGRRF